MKNSLYTLTLVFVLASQTLAAQYVNTKDLNLYFNTLSKNNRFMGTVMVYNKGEYFYTKSVGYANVADSLPNKRTTEYRIGSISKTITATLVLKAIEEGKLSLSDKLGTWFTTIPNADKITIEQLLNHHSGIFNFTNNPNYITFNTQPKTETELIAIIANGGSVFEPGTKGEYSNSNYVLLSYILEHVYKTDFATLVKEKISTPLQLTHLRFATKKDFETITTESYKFNGAWQKETVTDPSIPLGAGGIVTTAEDLVKFGVALFDGKLINEASLTQMKTLTDNYGLGLFKFPYNNKSAYGHMGSIDGYQSSLGIFEQDGYTFVVLSNALNYNINDIIITLLDGLFYKTITIPDFNVKTYTEQELKLYAGLYKSSELPINITISNEGVLLTAQGTGQPSFTLEGTKEVHTFENKTVGIKLVFKPDTNEMELQQMGRTFLYKRG